MRCVLLSSFLMINSSVVASDNLQSAFFKLNCKWSSAEYSLHQYCKLCWRRVLTRKCNPHFHFLWRVHNVLQDIGCNILKRHTPHSYHYTFNLLNNVIVNLPLKGWLDPAPGSAVWVSCNCYYSPQLFYLSSTGAWDGKQVVKYMSGMERVRVGERV